MPAGLQPASMRGPGPVCVRVRVCARVKKILLAL